MRFISPVRHPNVDEISGRICLDLLKMPPDGSWRPNISLSSVLVSIQVLLGCPNLNDVVRPELIPEFSAAGGTPLNEEENGGDILQPSNVKQVNESGTKRTLGLSLSFARKKRKSNDDDNKVERDE